MHLSSIRSASEDVKDVIAYTLLYFQGEVAAVKLGGGLLLVHKAQIQTSMLPHEGDESQSIEYLVYFGQGGRWP